MRSKKRGRTHERDEGRGTGSAAGVGAPKSMTKVTYLTWGTKTKT